MTSRIYGAKTDNLLVTMACCYDLTSQIENGRLQNLKITLLCDYCVAEI